MCYLFVGLPFFTPSLSLMCTTYPGACETVVWIGLALFKMNPLVCHFTNMDHFMDVIEGSHVHS